MPFLIQSYIRLFADKFSESSLNYLTDSPLFNVNYTPTNVTSSPIKEFVLTSRRKDTEDKLWIKKEILDKISSSVQIVYVDVPSHGNLADNKILNEWGHLPFQDNVELYRKTIFQILQYKFNC